MKKLFSIFLLLYSFISFGQADGTVIGNQTVISVPASGGVIRKALRWLPDSYNNPGESTTRYPLYIFLHGSGEAGNNAATLINTSLPMLISQGLKPYGIDSITGDTVKYIVISPQNPAWSMYSGDISFVLPNIIANYRVDTNRIYIGGLSAGGSGSWSVAANDSLLAKKFAAITPIAATDLNTGAEEFNLYRWIPRFKIAVWQVCGTEDSWYTVAQRYRDSINAHSPTKPNQLISVVGAGHTSAVWNPPYTLAYTGFAGKNMWTRLLDYSKAVDNSLPTSLAGLDQSITFPTNQVTLSGSGTPGAGNTITGYLWSKISGTGGTITSPTSATTTFTGLTPGIYVMRLTVTNSASVTAVDDMIVTVNDPPPSITSNSPTITLPTSTASLTSTASSTGTIVSTKWTKLFAPAQTKKNVVAMGSSTTCGSTLSNLDSSYINRFKAWAKAQNLLDTVYNLCVGGTAVDDAPIATAKTFNATAHIWLVNYPSNGYDSYTIPYILSWYRRIRDSAVANGKQFYTTGTQPRNSFNSAERAKLKVINDSLRIIFGDRFLDFYTPLVDPNSDNLIRIEYSSLDDIHANALGHERIGQVTIARNMFSNLVSSTSVISTPTTANTNVTTLIQGTHKFLVAIVDDRGFAASSVSTVTVNAPGSNVPPTADAGADHSITLPTNTGLLSGEGTDTDGTIASYLWTKISGTGGTIVKADTAITTATGLTAGVYVYRLTVTDDDGATGFDEVTITVNAQPTTCSGNRIVISPTDITLGGLDSYSNNGGFAPGDTIEINNSITWGYISLANIHGTPECPIVIINSGKVFLRDGFGLESCSYIKIHGTGLSDETYGFNIIGAVNNDASVAVHISKKSENIEINNLFINIKDYGFWIKNEAECDTTLNYPNHWLNNITVHHCYIRNMGSQGFYMGSTDPSALDRYIICDGDTVYYTPTRLSNIYIHNNIVDSTGRPGIQLSGGFEGENIIAYNTVSNSGFQFDEAQGVGISLGGYTRAYVHHNTIRKTYTWGIAALGASGHSIIEYNDIDSSGYLGGSSLNWPSNIFIDTRLTEPVDSTTFSIRLNTLGVHGSANANHIDIIDSEGTIGVGNDICGNTIKGSGLPALLNVAPGIIYTTTGCIQNRKQKLVIGIKFLNL